MPQTSLRRYSAEIALLIVAVIWGCAFVAQRTAMQHLGPFAFNGVRFGLGALIVWAVVFATRRFSSIQVSDVYLSMLLAAALFCGASFQQIGVMTTSAGKAGFITGLYIVLIPLFLRIFWKEPTSVVVWCGIFTAVGGLFLLSIGEDFSLLLGDVWVALCAVAFAWHMILTGLLVKHRDPWVLAALQFSFLAALSLAVAVVREPFTFGQVLSARIEILYAGILSVGVGYTAQTIAQKYASSVITGIILSLESVFAALAGWLLLDEVFTAQQKFGCALMLLGTFLAQASENKSASLEAL